MRRRSRHLEVEMFYSGKRNILQLSALMNFLPFYNYNTQCTPQVQHTKYSHTTRSGAGQQGKPCMVRGLYYCLLKQLSVCKRV
ncbi:hypothetical protein BaRGS_00013405 [Batillaria attramentaria]|uniref:Uncharacterized protein n=1 Tax=Batillaria attramentaria TaxID=370345 RepID=A0ABD0L865_9CAEN